MTRKPGKFLIWVATRPMEAVEYVIVSILFLSGCWLLSPLSVPPAAATASAISGHHWIAVLLGALQVVIGLTYYYAMWKGNGKRRVARGLATFSYFSLFLFYGISQVFLYGTERVTWLSTLGLALIAAIAYIRNRWERPEDERP